MVIVNQIVIINECVSLHYFGGIPPCIVGPLILFNCLLCTLRSRTVRRQPVVLGGTSSCGVHVNDQLVPVIGDIIESPSSLLEAEIKDLRRTIRSRVESASIRDNDTLRIEQLRTSLEVVLNSHLHLNLKSLSIQKQTPM
jgi:hypothetical protein